MARAIAETAASALFNEFVDIASSGSNIDELTLRRFSAGAQKALQHDFVVANVLLGVIAAYSFDAKSSIKHHSAATSIESSDFTHGNYSVSLSRLGLIDEALKESIKASKAEPTNLVALDFAIRNSLQAADIDSINELLAEWEKRSPNENSPFADTCRNLSSVLGKDSGLLFTEQAGIKICRRLLAAKKIPIVDFNFEIDDTENEESILHAVSIKLPFEEVLNLQNELALSLADELTDHWMPESIMFEYRSTQ